MDLEYRHGVISGVNPNAPLIDLGRGYNFANAGTINVQGMVQSLSAGNHQLYGSTGEQWTINVGTAQGKSGRH